MTSGEGIQRWPNCSVYVGAWKNHVYDGFGTLWNTSEDWKASRQMGESRQPMYVGNWAGGDREGLGTLMWEQDQCEYSDEGRTVYKRRAGLRKMYNGSLKDGLFNGEGTLLLRGAETAMLVSAASQATRRSSGDQGLGLVKLRAPQLHPGEMVNFKGTFGGDYQQVYGDFVSYTYDKV